MVATPFLMLFVFIECVAEEHSYRPLNVTRSTLSGLPAYRSLTLDWLSAEASRQRELTAAYTDASFRAISANCIAYPRPAAGKIGKLLLEVLKNLEDDESALISELIQLLLRSNILVDTSVLEMEPDLESLVKTPGLMMGEPHTTFPRILAIVWILATDPATSGTHGWCFLNKVNQYLATSKPQEIAQKMKTIEPVLARARFVMEEFIQNITPLNMYQKKISRKTFKSPQTERTTLQTSTKRHAIKQRANVNDFPDEFQDTQPSSSSKRQAARFDDRMTEGNHVLDKNGCSNIWWTRSLILLFVILV